MTISKQKLKEYRRLAENTTIISALGEYTPTEFIDLLDYIEELEEKLVRVCSAHKTCYTCGGPVNTSTGYIICERGCGGPVVKETKGD